MIEKKELGYKLVGFVDEKVNGKNGNTDELSCSLDELPDFLGNHVIDEVFLTLPVKTYYNRISEVIKACEQQGIPVHIPMDFFNGGVSKIKPVVIEGMPYIYGSLYRTETRSKEGVLQKDDRYFAVIVTYHFISTTFRCNHSFN